MALERTLSIVKPDGVSRNLIGEVYRRFEKAGLSVIAARMLHLSQREAEGFYAVHRERPFFKDLVKYMTLRPGRRAGSRRRACHREEPRDHGRHGSEEGRAGYDPGRPCAQHRAECRARSDAPETAAVEIAYFFRTTEFTSARLTPRAYVS